MVGTTADFRGFGPRPSLPINHLLCENRRTASRIGEDGLSTVEEGARAILNLATSPAVEGQTGLYFNGLREAKAQAQVYDPDARRRLQALSLALTGLSAEGMNALDR